MRSAWGICLNYYATVHACLPTICCVCFLHSVHLKRTKNHVCRPTIVDLFVCISVWWGIHAFLKSAGFSEQLNCGLFKVDQTGLVWMHPLTLLPRFKLYVALRVSFIIIDVWHKDTQLSHETSGLGVKSYHWWVLPIVETRECKL